MNKLATHIIFIALLMNLSCSYTPIKENGRVPSSVKSTCHRIISKIFSKNQQSSKVTESFLREDIIYEQAKKNLSIKPASILEYKLENGQLLQYLIDTSSKEVQALIKKIAEDTKKLKPDEKVRYFSDLFSDLIENSSLPSLNLRKSLNEDVNNLDGERSCYFCSNNPLLINLLMTEVNLRPQLNYYKVWRKVGNEVIEEEYGINVITVDGKKVIFDPTIKDFHQRDLNEFLQANREDSDRIIGITKRVTNPTAFIPTRKVNELEFRAQLSGSEETVFNIVNRNKAGKKFRAQASAFEEAGLEDDVDIEWVFTPYYVPLGHTNLRIGNSLYEFTSQGWKVHDTGGLTAETFLFNNSFFKKQYQTYKDKGMPGYSIGTSFTMKKREVLEFLESIGNHDPKQDSFSLLTRNCNQCAIDELKKVNFDAEKLSGTKFQEFSSVWTFRRLLHSPPFAIRESNIYHLSGENEPMTSFHNSFPHYLYERHSILDEVMRIIRGLNDRRKMQ